MSPRAKWILVAALAAVLAWRLAPLLGCSMAPYEAAFALRSRPDPPLENLLRGDLGVLRDGFTPAYLYIAYRVLAGVGFDDDERQAVRSFLDDWLARKPEPVDPKPAMDAWLRMRPALAPPLGAPSPIYPYGRIQKTYQNYLNCNEDAFHNATVTLQARMKQFGAASPAVRQWIEGQNAVFANCSAQPARVIPASLGPDADPLVRADRAYQIAAAHFHAGNFDDAEKMFRAIAADRASPWRTLAPYLVARCRVRRATLTEDAGVTRRELAAAESQLNAVLGDAGLAEVHAAARRLLDFVSFRLHPSERLGELAEAVIRKGAGATLKQDLFNYRRLLDNPAEDPHDVTVWIRGGDSIGRWRVTGSLPWLVAALMTTKGTQPEASALIEAAAKVPENSPAYPTAAYHTVRLMIESGRRDDARTRLDALLRSAPPSSSYANLLRAARFQLSRSYDEFLQFALRTPVAICCDLDGSEFFFDRPWLAPSLRIAMSHPLLDADSTWILNKRIPLAMLRDTARRADWPEPLRHDVALATWTRAALLDNTAVAQDVAGSVPELDLKPYLAAGTPAGRRFAAVFVMLHFPGLRPYVNVSTNLGRLTAIEKIDDLRENWWCPVSQNPFHGFHSGERQAGDQGPAQDLASPGYLTGAQKSAAQQEWDALAALSSAPSYFGRHVLDWANAHPDDPRVPEALHLVVRATRFGCGDSENAKWSRAAFTLLHKSYPNTEWAAKTKYWFK